jgi:cupin 2 domain-containing protein
VTVENLFAGLPHVVRGELTTVLLESDGIRIERIVSADHATPPGDWYDQAWDEWVVLLTGRAGLRFEDEAAPRTLVAGDHVRIAAHRRHRVEWTDAAQPTLWLAVHYRPPVSGG